MNSAGFSIRFRESVRKDLRKIPKADVQRILQRINALQSEPRPPQAEMLTGDTKYRIRQGNYRILCEIEDDLLTVCAVKVGHHKDVYRM
ncbi:MAG: type II toxin-antitoxin system RelE/ParE family toxin [Mariprofundaceae bacterium]|nr:type II toxin-antitoxin system RelE/ParE family toxin [Mariprofundaceae bacterium]